MDNASLANGFSRVLLLPVQPHLVLKGGTEELGFKEIDSPSLVFRKDTLGGNDLPI